MARAGEIKGIRPKRHFGDNARLVVDTRLEEFISWGDDALADEANVEALHDMRIAAKRLRYALEMFEVCFPEAKQLLKPLTQIQEDLGDIHDLDVLAERLRARLETLDRPLAQQAIAITLASNSRGEQMNRLRGALFSYARSPIRLGLLGLLGDKAVERHEKYEAFRSQWTAEGLEQFADDLRRSVGLIPPAASSEEAGAAEAVEGSTA